MNSYTLFENTKKKEILGDPFLDLLLSVRNINTKKEAEDFMSPSYEKNIGDPFLIYGMKKGAQRIVKAIKENEKIAIYSDYDCDGIPGGVIFRDFLEGIGYKNYVVYIPHRIKEGYGLHNKAIDELKLNDVKLIITIDLAITNIDEAIHAKKNNIDLIITDHHLPIHNEPSIKESLAGKKRKEILPDAFVVINSKQEKCTYEDDMLCGAAVAWKLACAVLSLLKKEKKIKKSDDTFNLAFNLILENVKKLPEGWEKWLLDLVGIATIADLVPLRKENRALAHFGLRVLRKTRRPGLLKIFAVNKIDPREILEEDISFTIAPRINAAGRMDTPLLAHKLLFEKNFKEAFVHADLLEKLNQERKVEVKSIITDMLKVNTFEKEIIVIGDESWTPGVLGLIAQSVLDKTNKPIFVWGKGDESDAGEIIYKGSCRSRGDVHVVELMSMCKDVLIHSGGHEQAGGFAISKEKIGLLSDSLNNALKHTEVKKINSEDLLIDKLMTFDEINFETYEKIKLLSPFGVGNAKPLFAFKKVLAKKITHFGKEKNHLEITYEGTGGRAIKAIIFNKKDSDYALIKEPHTLIASVEKNTFMGKNEIRLKIKDIVSPSLL